METNDQNQNKAPRKKFWNYVHEFLMLFLAITLGFFVENQRGRYIESKQAKQFAGHMISDLASDTAFYGKTLNSLNTADINFEKLKTILLQPAPVNDSTLIANILPVSYVYDVKLTSATYDQMKSSGSLRFFKNHELIAQLQQYYDISIPQNMKWATSADDFFTDYYTKYTIENLRYQDIDFLKNNVVNNKPVILNRSRQTDQYLLNIMENYRIYLKVMSEMMYPSSNQKAIKLIEAVKKEYHLE